MSASLLWLVLELADRDGAARSLVATRGVDLAGYVFEATDVRAEREELISIAHHEARFDWRAVGDSGHAFGAWQLHGHWFAGHSGDALLDSPALQTRLTLRAIRHLKAVCGPQRLRWMGAFACGSCGACPGKARELCAPIGCNGGGI